jgi:hypothetical protein
VAVELMTFRRCRVVVESPTRDSTRSLPVGTPTSCGGDGTGHWFRGRYTVHTQWRDAVHDCYYVRVAEQTWDDWMERGEHLDISVCVCVLVAIQSCAFAIVLDDCSSQSFDGQGCKGTSNYLSHRLPNFAKESFRPNALA